MKCNRCGAELLPNDTFCGNCGNKINIQVTRASTGRGMDAPSLVRPEAVQERQKPNVGLQYDSWSYPQNGMPYRNNTTKSTNNNRNVAVAAKKKSNGSVVVIIVAVIVFLLVLFTGFNYLLMTERIDSSQSDFLEQYKDSLGDFLNISYRSEDPKIDDKTDAVTSPDRTPYTETQTYVQISDDEKDDYLFPSDSRLLTEEYLNSKSNNEIDLIRNEIYARHGYIFQMEEFYNYFIQKSWYRPVESDMNKVYESFNQTEKQNIEILSKYQNLK